MPPFGCNTNENTCFDSGTDYPDQIENYMDYSDGNCQNMFSLDQISRMQATLSGPRASLQNSGACAPPQLPPVADFTSDAYLVCAGTPVQFSDNSQFVPTSWSWQFPGAVPSTSTDPNPTVVYAAAGTYQVTLTATNQYGNDVVTKNDFIRIGQYGEALPFTEDFETGGFVAGDWVLENPDNSTTWNVTNIGGNGSLSAAKMDFKNSSTGELDALITPSLNLNGISNAELSFEHSYPL